MGEYILQNLMDNGVAGLILAMFILYAIGYLYTNIQKRRND